MKRECEHIVLSNEGFHSKKFTVVYDSFYWNKCPVCRLVSNIGNVISAEDTDILITELFEE